MEHKPKIRVSAVGPCSVGWFQLVPGSPMDDLVPKSFFIDVGFWSFVVFFFFFDVLVTHLLVELLCCILLKFSE